MTTADGWTAAVRERLSLGRLLPLGGPADGAWLAERAAAAELRRTATVPGAVLGRLRIGRADSGPAGTPEVKPPPSALPPGALRIEADFSAVAGDPLPDVARRLRAALLGYAVDRLGLLVEEVDLRVTALLEAEPDSPGSAEPAGVSAVTAEGTAAVTAANVTGVAHLTGSLGPPVVAFEGHVRVELATAARHHPLEVARAVREAVSAALPGHPAVAVLVTAVGVEGRPEGGGPEEAAAPARLRSAGASRNT